jgi:hypothetical protein
VADRELTARLATRGLAGSSTRYERWRRAGLLPRHERRGAGRGHGSVSVLDSTTVEIAAALARHAGQGRDLRAAVVAWFFEAGHPIAPDEPAVPEPPEEAVAGALAWAVRTDPGYHMLQRARAAITEAQQDKFYEDAATLARRNPDRAAEWTHRPSVQRCSAAGISPRPPAGNTTTSSTSLLRSAWAPRRSALRPSPTRSLPPACSRRCPRRSGGMR